MIIRFREQFDLPLEEVFSYFRTPADWARLYGLAGTVKDRGDGWVAVPLKSFPFPLVAKNTEVVPNERVHWDFRGFWRGEGEVRFSRSGDKTVVEGYECISVRWLGGLSALAERWFLEKRFQAVWSLGWQRLRKAERHPEPLTPPPTTSTLPRTNR